MSEDRDIVLFRIDRKTGILILAALAVVTGGIALSEQLTLTTSYPVPSGIYNQLITTGNSGTIPADTTLNRNAGNTLLVPATNASGMVGIGMSPAAKLSVAGGVQLGDDNTACTAAKAGTQRWHAGAVSICDGASWIAATPGTSVKMYKCPGPVSLGGGAWGFYGCQYQLTPHPSCYEIEFPTTRTFPCTYAGTVTLGP